MFCPVCGRTLSGPPTPTVPFPMYICAYDGVIHDQKRDLWHGLPEAPSKFFCPVCGGVMEVEPKAPPHRIFYCFQCGTTYDRERTTWFGLAYYRGR